MPLSSEQLNQLINLLASITLLEMMVAIGLGVSIGDLLHVPPIATTIAGALLCFALRLMAIQRGWRLPVAPRPERSSSKKHAPDDETME